MAQLHATPDGAPVTRRYVDAGAGLRVGMAGADWAAVRLDVARSLAVDHRWALTAGFMPPWPMRLGRAR